MLCTALLFLVTQYGCTCGHPIPAMHSQPCCKGMYTQTSQSCSRCIKIWASYTHLDTQPNPFKISIWTHTFLGAMCCPSCMCCISRQVATLWLMHALMDSGTRVLVRSARLAQLFHVALSSTCATLMPTQRSAAHWGSHPCCSLGSLCGTHVWCNTLPTQRLGNVVGPQKHQRLEWLLNTFKAGKKQLKGCLSCSTQCHLPRYSFQLHSVYSSYQSHSMKERSRYGGA